MTSRTIYLHGTAISAVAGSLTIIVLGYFFEDDAKTIGHEAFWYCCGMLNAYLVAQRPRATMTERKDIDWALRHIERVREATTRDYERAMRKLDNDERDLLGLKPVADGEASERTDAGQIDVITPAPGVSQTVAKMTKLLKTLAGATGLEPATSGVTGRTVQHENTVNSTQHDIFGAPLTGAKVPKVSYARAVSP